MVFISNSGNLHGNALIKIAEEKINNMNLGHTGDPSQHASILHMTASVLNYP